MTSSDDDWRTALARLSERVRAVDGGDEIFREL